MQQQLQQQQQALLNSRVMPSSGSVSGSKFHLYSNHNT
uniref:Transcriptional regulator myc-a-like protein n=1 Tax=Triatoma infestans TaxID=30076 RepID=A0A161MGL8_TRIIF